MVLLRFSLFPLPHTHTRGRGAPKSRDEHTQQLSFPASPRVFAYTLRALFWGSVFGLGDGVSMCECVCVERASLLLGGFQIHLLIRRHGLRETACAQTSPFLLLLFPPSPLVTFFDGGIREEEEEEEAALEEAPPLLRMPQRETTLLLTSDRQRKEENEKYESAPPPPILLLLLCRLCDNHFCEC